MKSIAIKQRFDELASEVVQEAESFTFNLKDLPEIKQYPHDIRKEQLFKNIFESLDQKLSNCIYWFEVATIAEGQMLQQQLDNQRQNLTISLRTVPARNSNTNSVVLYVGIRRGGLTKKYELSHISDRIRQHLGYYSKGSTQGLQFAHWARKLDCIVTLKVVQFQELPNDYLNTIEKILAFKLKPLCGKH